MASTSKKSTTKKTATKQSSKAKTTTKSAPKKKMGRPKKVIDQRQFESMCGYQCTLEEICGILGVTDVTLNTWCKETYGTTFSEVFKEKRSLGRMSLRRTQFKLAEKNATMAIFLGKQYLGQTDHVEVVDNTHIERLDAILGGIKSIAMQGANNGTEANTETE